MFKYVPNILSTFRIILVPVFAYIFFLPIENARIYALIIYAIASITDFIDGYIARKYDLISKVGTVLDPLADKLLLITSVVCFYIAGNIPLLIVVIIIGKELFMILGGIYLYFHKSNIVIPSNIFGKVATVIFTVAILTTLVYPESILSFTLLSIALCLSIVALISYSHHYVKNIKKTM